MTFSRKLTAVQVQKLLVDYEDGFLIKDLAPRYGVSLRTVHRVLQEANVSHRYNHRKKRKDDRVKSPRELKPCGTNAAYVRHRRHGEYPCADCLEAHNEENRKRRA